MYVKLSVNLKLLENKLLFKIPSWGQQEADKKYNKNFLKFKEKK